MFHTIGQILTLYLRISKNAYKAGIFGLESINFEVKLGIIRNFGKVVQTL